MWREELIEALIESEGVVHHMYLDSEGNPTVGVGHLLRFSALLNLHWELKESPGVAAPENVVTADFWRVSAANGGRREPQNRTAASFDGDTHTRLTLETIKLLLLSDIDATAKQVQARLKGTLDTYPSAAILALMDMAFNLGCAGLFRQFPNMIKAFMARRWWE